MTNLMACSQKARENEIQTASLIPGNGWSGRVVLSDQQGRQFQKADWLNCLSQPHLLFEDVEKILKTEGRNCVAVKNLTIGNTRLKVVIKRHHPGGGLRQFFRSLPRGRALRSFDTALELLSCGVPVITPFAALHKRRNLRTLQSIYITEFFENSSNLYNFASEQLPKKQAGQFSIKKQLCHQLAAILAILHQNGLWHRDSKATNFIVCGGENKVLLADVDGIKPYFIRQASQRFRSLWQLAASLLSLPSVNRTDYLRCFTKYCNLTGIDSSHRRVIFLWLSALAQAKHRRSMGKNILLIKPSSLGDIVLALPALSALQRSFPDAKISWLVRPEFASLLKNHPDLTEVILFDRKFLGQAWFHPGAFVSLLSLIRRLRRGRFDTVIDLQGLFRTASLAWLSGSKRRFGIANPREFAHIFYTDKITQDYSCIHLVDYYLRMVAAAGAQIGRPEFRLPKDSAADKIVKKLLMKHKVNLDNYVVLVPGAARPEKRWLAWNFSEIADKIAEKFGSSIVATGLKKEQVLIEVLQKLATTRIANLAGQTSILELVALLKGARLVVSNDTGPGHIAAALGVPVVMLFGPTNPARVHPYNRPECAVAVEPDGRGFKADSYDPKHTIKAITVDEVYQKVCEQLSRDSSPIARIS
jgi:lipopolysaccharide heptosyltransferase I